MFKKYVESGLLLAVLAIEPLASPIWQASGNRQAAETPGTQPRKIKPHKSAPRYQRDPIQLVKEFYLDKSPSRPAFNAALAVENALGSGAWSKLSEKQRAAVTKAYDATAASVLKEWNSD